jgi:hypothetical protein
MVRPWFVTRALPLLLLVAGGPPGAALAADVPADARPFEALLAGAAAVQPGTYVLDGTALVPVPEGSRIPVMLQADVLRGPERSARVGLVVGAAASQAMEARVLVSTVAAGGTPARVVADAGGKAAAGPLRLVRELSLEPGDYDVQALVGDARQGTGLLAVARSRMSVPDIRAGALVVTPIVVGEAGTAPASSPVPFVFGQTTLTPAVDPRLPQGGAISVAFRVYNWTAAAEEKPDLTVEYLFYEQGQHGLHFFNKVKPQPLNGETLGPSYDPSAGSVAAGMRIPLAAFTFGEFQLLVRVTDNRGGKTAEQTLRFTVVP